METPVPEEKNRSLLEIQNTEGYTNEELRIISLLLIRKIKSGLHARMQKALNKELDITKNDEGVAKAFEISNQLRAIRDEEKDMIRQTALEFGISQARFLELSDFVYQQESKF